jgi:hypothetical protein
MCPRHVDGRYPTLDRDSPVHLVAFTTSRTVVERSLRAGWRMAQAHEEAATQGPTLDGELTRKVHSRPRSPCRATKARVAGGTGVFLRIPRLADCNVAGAGATIFSAQSIGDNVRVPIRSLALLPTIVNRSYGLTDVVMKMIEQLSTEYKIPVLNAIRTDQNIGKAARVDPQGKALEDYEAATTGLLPLFGADGVKADALQETPNAERIAV